MANTARILLPMAVVACSLTACAVVRPVAGTGSGPTPDAASAAAVSAGTARCNGVAGEVIGLLPMPIRQFSPSDWAATVYVLCDGPS